jgi:thioredoxin 2
VRALDKRARCGACKTELAPPAEPVNLGSAAELEAMGASSALPVLVDFWAGWCAPCAMVAPEVAKLATSRAGRLLVVKADTEADPALGARYSIRSIPTFVLLWGGRELGRISGALPLEGLQQFVDGALAGASS